MSNIVTIEELNIKILPTTATHYFCHTLLLLLLAAGNQYFCIFSPSLSFRSTSN